MRKPRRKRLAMTPLFWTIVLATACATVTSVTPPSAMPSPAATPEPPPGYAYVTEPALRISLARPADSERDAATKTLPITGGIVQYVVYYNVSPGQAQVVNIMNTKRPFHPSEGEGFLEQYLDENTQALESNGFKVLEHFRDVTVAGQTAFAIAYRITDPRGAADYSIILPLTYSDGTGLLMQWGSSEDLAFQTRDTFPQNGPDHFAHTLESTD